MKNCWGLCPFTSEVLRGKQSACWDFWKISESSWKYSCYVTSVSSWLQTWSKEGGKEEHFFGYWKGFTPLLWREKYVMLGNYWNNKFYKQALICDLHVQGAKAVILQEDLQKLLAASAGSWACAMNSCVWHLLDFYSRFQHLEGHLPPLVASQRNALGTNDYLLFTHAGTDDHCGKAFINHLYGLGVNSRWQNRLWRQML